MRYMEVPPGFSTCTEREEYLASCTETRERDTNQHDLEIFAHSFGKHGENKGVGDSGAIPDKESPVQNTRQLHKHSQERER